jgi:hypothetical protein
MFFVSRDRFSMDLESATLELMVKLLDGDGGGGGEDAELTRMQARIQDTCQHLQNEGRKFDIHIDEVSVSSRLVIDHVFCNDSCGQCKMLCSWICRVRNIRWQF